MFGIPPLGERVERVAFCGWSAVAAVADPSGVKVLELLVLVKVVVLVVDEVTVLLIVLIQSQGDTHHYWDLKLLDISSLFA